MEELGCWVIVLLFGAVLFVGMQIFNLIADNAAFFAVVFLIGVSIFILYRLLKTFTEKQEAAEKEKRRLRSIAEAPEPAPKLYPVPQNDSSRQYEFLRLTEQYISYVTAENSRMTTSARLQWLKEKEHAQVMLGLPAEQRVGDNTIATAKDEAAQAEQSARTACWTGWKLVPTADFTQEQEKFRAICRVMNDKLPEPASGFFAKTNIGALYLSNGKYLICTFWYPVLYDETANSFTILAYNKISTKRDYRLDHVDGYGYGEDVAEQHWYHEKKNGGPDLRYNDNPTWVTVYRGIAAITCDGLTRKIEYPNRKAADAALEAVKSYIDLTKKEKFKKYTTVLLKTKDLYDYAALVKAVETALAASADRQKTVAQKQKEKTEPMPASKQNTEKEERTAQQQTRSAPIAAATQQQRAPDTPQYLPQRTDPVLPRQEPRRKSDFLLNLDFNSAAPSSTPPGSREPYRARNAAGQQVTARKTEYTYIPTILKPEQASPAKGDAQQEIPMAPEFVMSAPKGTNSTPSTDGEVQTVDFNCIELGEYVSPIALTCFGTRMTVNSWKELYVAACQIIYKERPRAFDRLFTDKSDDSVRWIVRPERLSTLKIPQAIGVSCFIETYGNAETYMNHLKYIMDKCWVSYSDVAVEYIEKQPPKSKNKVVLQKPSEPKRTSAFIFDEKSVVKQKKEPEKARVEQPGTDERKSVERTVNTEQRVPNGPERMPGSLPSMDAPPKEETKVSTTKPASMQKANIAAGQIRLPKHIEFPADAKVIKLPTQSISESKSGDKSRVQSVDFNHIESMAGTKPVALHYGSRVEQVSSWASLYVKLCENIMIYHGGEFAAMVNVPFKENERLWLTTESQSSQLRKPRLIGNRYYIETNCNATDIVKNCKRILDACMIDYTKVIIEYRYIDEALKPIEQVPKAAGTVKEAKPTPKVAVETKPVSMKPVTPQRRVSQPQQVPQLILTDEERKAVLAARQAKAESEAQARRMQEQQAAQAAMAFDGTSALVQVTGNAVITNNLFKLTFEQAVDPETEVYQLYFVDDMGKTISTKQQIKAAAKGTTSTATFSLQASNGFDSKKEYYLLIYDTEGRLKGKLPYQIKISFASDFDF